MSFDVALSRERPHGSPRQIFEKVGKTLKRNGGDDGARTRDLRRKKPAFAGGLDRLISITCRDSHIRAALKYPEPAASEGHFESEPRPSSRISPILPGQSFKRYLLAFSTDSYVAWKRDLRERRK